MEIITKFYFIYLKKKKTLFALHEQSATLGMTIPKVPVSDAITDSLFEIH